MASIASRLGRRRRAFIRVIGDPAEALSALRELANLKPARVDDRTLSVTFDREEDLAEAVRRVAAAGAGVVAVEPEHGDLERAFLELTQGELQ